MIALPFSRLLIVPVLAIIATPIGATPSMSQTPVDRAALAVLRLGATQAEVAQAYGDAWQPPLPHREGRILTIDMSDGVVARLTTTGKLGSIRYNWRFGEENSVAGIKMGASENELKARFPTLDLAALSGGPFYLLSLTEDGQHFRLELGTTYEDERYLRWIEKYDPEAVYPPKQPVGYPVPSGEPGSPFKDVNLKLAVLSSLINSGQIDIGDPQDFYDFVLGRRFDLEEEGYEPIPAARDYLARFPLTEELLNKVTSITFDGGEGIYEYVHYFWDGESDEFDVTSLRGIDALPNLKELHIASMIDESTVDLEQLRTRGIKVR